MSVDLGGNDELVEALADACEYKELIIERSA